MWAWLGKVVTMWAWLGKVVTMWAWLLSTFSHSS
jgi:hypothetical protein